MLLVTGIGLLLTLQGWKSHAPAFDMLTYFLGVDAFVDRGAILAYGDVSSYGAFSPPGTFWLMLPGRLLLTDPRLFEKLGAALLQFGTLLGVMAVGRTAFGTRCGVLAVVLYGLSGLGLAFAGSLWPIGQPFFYVWMAYLAMQWVGRRDATYLAAAFAVWAVGMYVDMAIAPAGLVLGALWIVRRPPLFSTTLALGLAVVLAVWFPFLNFESGRDFTDLKSLLLLQNINPTNYQQAWCDPDIALVTLPGAGLESATPAQPSLSVPQRVERRFGAILDGLQATFAESVQLPGVAVVLLLAALGGLGAGWWRGPEAARLFVICLAVPWALLLLIAEPGRTERFLWLWPLQIIAVAAFATYGLANVRLPRQAVGAVSLLTVVLLSADPLRFHLQSWLQGGWAGTDAEEVQVVDYAGAYLRAHGKDHVAVGYETFVYPFMARYHAIDPDYKVGAEFDLLFRYRYGIVNLNQCGEGVSSADDLRIVQQRPQDVPGAPDQYFAVERDPAFKSLGQVGSYEIFTRI